MKSLLILFGPSLNSGRVGGYLTNVSAYTKLFNLLGFKTLHCPLSLPRDESQILLFHNALTRAIGDLLLIISLLLRHLFDRDHPTRISYILSVRGSNIYRELFIVSLSKLLNYKLFYDVKAGNFIDQFNRSSVAHRLLLKLIIHFSNCILCEGAHDIGFIHQHRSRSIKPFYFPNFIDVQHSAIDLVRFKAHALNTSKSSFELVYFGRMTEAKGVFRIIKFAEILASRNLCYQVNINLYGPFETADERQHFDHALNDFNSTFKTSNVRINYFGSLPPSEISSVLRKSDILLFLSLHYGEGHSNSVNEAIASGIYVISTSHGFHSSAYLDGTAMTVIDAESDYQIAKEAADAVCSIFANPSAISNLILNNYSYCVNNFSLQAAASRFESLLKKIP